MESKVVVPEVYTSPLLAESPKGLIVLFNAECSGTVMCAGDTSYKVGDYRDMWISVTDPHWKVLPKGTTVTLTQE